MQIGEKYMSEDNFMLGLGGFNPRNPDKSSMVRTQSCAKVHDDIREVYVLLSLETKEGKVFFVVDGFTSANTYEELQEDARYYYETHTCPTNFISIPLICFNGDTDVHGIFKFEEAVWKVSIPKVDDEYFLNIFPQLERPSSNKGTVI